MTADKWLLYFNGSLYGAEHVTRRCCCLCPGTVRGVWLPVWKGQRQTALRWPAGGHNTFGTLPTLCSAVALSEKWGLGSATTPLPWVLPGLCEASGGPALAGTWISTPRKGTELFWDRWEHLGDSSSASPGLQLAHFLLFLLKCRRE